MKRALIVVARQPIPGKTKTRLSPPLTHTEAVDLYKSFLLDTLDLVSQVDACQPVIAYTPATATSYFRRVAPSGFAFLPQVGRNLGERLDNVLTTCLHGGADLAVVMNSDAPTLPVPYIQQAFQLLGNADTDVVLGPSEDGGYYLLGLKQPCSALFGIVMSTPTVLSETLQLAREQALRVACLDTWHDIDTPADLRCLLDELVDLSPSVAVRTRETLSNIEDLLVRLDQDGVR